MTNINEIKISLMESQGAMDPSTGKSDYIMKTSATFKFNEYVEKTYPEADEEDREEILKQISALVFQDIVLKTKDKFDSVGIWVTVGDQVFDNSIDSAVLSGIKEHGEKDIVPIYEFIKMTLSDSE
jgi:acetate kinase